MNRRGRYRQAPRLRRPRRLLSFWTLSRATGTGILAGLLALLLAGLLGISGEPTRYLYALLLAVAAACGASILWITATDMRSRGTSGRMRPIRGFDLAIGFALLLPSLYALHAIWPQLGL